MARARLDLALAAYRDRRRLWIVARGLAASAGRQARVPGSRLAAASHVANQPPLGVGDWLN